MVGHSAGALLAAHLAADLNARALVCLDGSMPPASGSTPPASGWFRKFLDTLPVADGRLPKWNMWWGRDLLEGAALDPDFKAILASEIPELRLDWFEDQFEMPDWSKSAKYFIRTSQVMDEEGDRAEGAGWSVIRLDGTHLHPTLQPEATAAELATICKTLS